MIYLAPDDAGYDALPQRLKIDKDLMGEMRREKIDRP
jgi:hypothetical protein